MQRARKVDEEEQAVRRKQEEEKEALRKKKEEEEVRKANRQQISPHCIKTFSSRQESSGNHLRVCLHVIGATFFLVRVHSSSL